MIVFFVILVLVSLLGAFWSLIRPSTFACRFWPSPKRTKLFFSFLGFGFLFFILFGIYSPPVEDLRLERLQKTKQRAELEIQQLETKKIQQIEKEKNKEIERLQLNAKQIEKEESDRLAKADNKVNVDKKEAEIDNKKSILLSIKETILPNDQPKTEQKKTDPIYIERIYGSEAKAIYSVMKANSLLPDKDGSDKSKMAAILVSGYVFKDDDPCIEGKNPKKCLLYVKEAINSEIYKTELDASMARVKPLPDATEKERKDAAWQQGTRMCDDLVRKGVTIPSTVDFAWGGSFDAYTDGTFIKTGTFTHKNSYGQKLKKKYECKITMSKKGFDAINAKIINLYEDN